MKEESVLSIKEVSNKEDLKQAQKIRIKVLEKEQGFPHNLNIDMQVRRNVLSKKTNL